MAKTFRRAFQDAIERTGTSIKVVATEAGVSYEQLKKVLQRENASTNVDDAVKVANYFGQTLDEFLDDRTAIVRSEIVDLYNQLSELERRILLGSVKGAHAARVSSS